jgi:hypothetical protein
MTQLTPHFSIEELTHSDTTVRLGIDNDAPLEVVAALRKTALNLEQVRLTLNSNAMHIHSGYRCEALESVICARAFEVWCLKRSKPVNDASWAAYFALKSHSKGQAADWTCPTAGTPRQIVERLRNSGIVFDQLICEFPDSPGGGWVHTSFSDTPRGDVLLIDDHGTRNFII